MAALAVLKQKPLKVGEKGPTIVITQDDVDYYQKVVSEDGSNVPVAVGEEITQYEALQALLLPSANNMAHTLAVWAYGSEKQYTAFVNNFSKTLGMNNAHFDDASGYSPETVASSEDLARLAVNAMDNPVIAEIVAQPDAVIPVAGRIYNVNALLGRDGIVGVKTGNTEQAGGVFMAAASRDISGQRIVAVSVIMGATNLGEAMRNSVPLINSVFDGFEQVTLVKASQVVGTYTVPWGSSVNVTAKQDVKGVVWRGNPIKADIALRPITVPQEPVLAQTQVGSIQGSFGRAQVDSAALLAGDIQQPPLLWRFRPRFI
jgi:D-alanyl-D-alanine carboxypeptidase (penicillin-binding protein 5/6)